MATDKDKTAKLKAIRIGDFIKPLFVVAIVARMKVEHIFANQNEALNALLHQGFDHVALQVHHIVKAIISGDRTHLDGVLSNLLDNAVRYAGEVPPQITVALYQIVYS